MNPSDQPSAVAVNGLSRKFGGKLALDQVSLQVKRGRVFGLAGANGAGKTTLIKHLLGRLKAESGSVRVFGFDPVADPVAVLSRIGYLSENRDLPGWMRVDELIRYAPARDFIQPLLPAALICLFGIKLALAFAGFRISIRRGLMAVWVLMAAALVVPAAAWFHKEPGIFPACLVIILLIPLARIGFCPISMSWSRHG